jgi:hypothetical protein
VALRRNLPTRAPERDHRPEDVREYDPRTGSWSRVPGQDDRPVPGTPNGTNGRLRPEGGAR